MKKKMSLKKAINKWIETSKRVKRRRHLEKYKKK